MDKSIVNRVKEQSMSVRYLSYKRRRILTPMEAMYARRIVSCDIEYRLPLPLKNAKACDVY